METKLREFGRLICSIAQGKTMNREQARDAYRQVILNEQPELQQGAFLMAHIARGPTTEELAGAWDALDRYDTAKIDFASDRPIADIVGTGSDSLKTVNCSTPAALIAAAAGLTVAKKGARLVTGVSGASDIFEMWGIDLNAPLSAATDALRSCGICYLPGESFLLHGWARLIRSMRFTSAFNIVGPLTMPCPGTNHIVIGAYSPEVCRQLVEILREINVPAAISPFGKAEGTNDPGGMDEFSPCGPTQVVELKDGTIETYTLTPSDFGCRTHRFETIASHPTAQGNANAILDVLRKMPEGPLADFFCMNAGAALRIAGLAPDFRSATEMARNALASGKANEKLHQLRSIQGER